MHHKKEHEIIKNWQGDMEHPVVSVSCITYNHEAYIAETIEGILMQETDFPFEILIHDDASTDKTADIIRAYEQEYPAIIKAIYQTKNQYSKGVKANATYNFSRSLGKYMALCEGDDYWTDPNKLQIQVDYLEQHPEVVISGHDAYMVDENGKKIEKPCIDEKNKRDFTREEMMLDRAWVLTMSRVYRNIKSDHIYEKYAAENGDAFELLILGQHGSSHFHSDIKPGAYRVHPGGIWSMQSVKRQKDMQLNTRYWMYRYYLRIGEKEYADKLWKKYLYLVFERADIYELFFNLIKRTLSPFHAKIFVRDIMQKAGLLDTAKRILNKT